MSILSKIKTGVLIDSGKKNRLTDLPIKKPIVIVDYNNTMGCVLLVFLSPIAPNTEESKGTAK